ncbi:hypothetical protein ACG33_07610 [Steroidobacter denitrificans]|uniref:Peptidase C39-like domain-containing protein n=1 Tax=Steroidobacter denitrificans TaxID=465721 RepID=A0A127F966_STEDE|nr:PA2778 family cysteine peptidase [Steroidobacter denitrificans]AMN46964.1 hypothetical protein ACG33_07610 [Steroidobacter denitrificans]
MRLLRHAASAWLVIAVLCGCALQPTKLTTANTSDLPAQVELAQVPFFAQQQYQCGPAALATVLQAAGVSVLPGDLVEDVYLPGRKGSLQLELLAATRRRDHVPYLLAESLPAVLEQVAVGRPVLVMQNLGLKVAPAWHFAVLVGYDLQARTLILRSGTTRRLVIGMDRFIKTWARAQSWGLIVLAPDQLPKNPDLERYLTAAAGLEAVGRLDAAAQAYASARAQWPHSVWPAVGLANISYRKGDLRSAEDGYVGALALDADNIVAHNNLAEILAGRGCFAAARVHIARAAALATGTTLESAVAATAQKVDTAASFVDDAACPQP